MMVARHFFLLSALALGSSLGEELVWSFSDRGAPPEPLPNCHGDCDKDSHCAGDLICFQRAGTEAVPGCTGEAAHNKQDFCAYRPSQDYLWLKGNNGRPKRNFPLGLCEGECDTDAECAEGLICFQRDDEPVPGCIGVPESRKDYCIDPSQTLPPTPAPTPAPVSATTLLVVFSGTGDPPSPLSGCRGDCDNDEQCEGDLVCFQRSGTEAVPGCEGDLEATSSVDFCAIRETENTVWLMGDNGSPAANFPLGLCSGDCDNDGECQPGLTCQQRVADEPIPGCIGVPETGKDYCRLPDPTSAPSNAPTPVPSNAPSNAPTSQPSNAPTSQPSNAPTAEPSNSPTSNPTNAPSHSPTSSPTSEPTASPSNAPTSNPTALPTSNPTSVPTNKPTNVGDPITCPAEPGSSVALTSGGTTSFARSSATSFCGIFIDLESGNLIPYARSYSGNDWEPSPGPNAVLYAGINCSSTACTIDLPSPSSGSYVIMSKPTNSLSNEDKIARFLEMTTFGPKMAEIQSSAASGSFGDAERAAAVRDQMDMPKTSHREYFRQNANPKLDTTTQTARTDHPCDPHSRWRNYAFTKLDREHTITEDDIYYTFEEAPEDAGSTFTMYQADSQDDVDHGTGVFRTAADGNGGFAGSGYYDMGGYDDYVQFSVTVDEAIDIPISFRYAQGSSRFGGNRQCVLSVNDVVVRDVYDFTFSDSWAYWIYSEKVVVSLTAGLNTIKLLVRDQNGGPNVDFLRLGSPPALLMKTNGWLRHVAKDGVGVVNDWGIDFTDQTVYFTSNPYIIEGDLYRYPFGRLGVNVTTQTKYLDIGNPELDFEGYESHLPSSHFILNNGEVFEDTSSDIYNYPIVKGQEFMLPSGLDRALYPICDTITSNEEGSAPVFAKTPDGKWLQWSPTIKLETNGPSMNTSPEELASSTLIDGGGEAILEAGEQLKCANVARSFENEDTCIYSTVSTACSPTREIGVTNIVMDEINVKKFYELEEKYVYAITGLAMESLSEHACSDSKSRWEVELDTVCPQPTSLSSITETALQTAFASSTDPNDLLKDINGPHVCDAADVTVENLGMQIQVGADCYTHVHRDHKNVYDFSGWVSNHPGGEYNIQKWAQGTNGSGPVPGWYLDYPFPGVPERSVPQHPMSRWYTHMGEPNIVFVAKLGNSIPYRDLPSNLKTNSIAEYFGAIAFIDGGAGTVVCGSHGEVANDRTLREQFEVRTDGQQVSDSDMMDNQRHVVWYEVGMNAPDQLRQRMAFALSEMITIVPQNIDAITLTEIYTKYYDIFVKHAFGNYGDIMKLVSYSPLMAEHLTFVKSKSHPYIYRKEDKRVSSPDENYSREIMQLFTIGLYALNEDGTQVIDSATGKPKETYTNEDIESFARAWTGFDRQAVRGNYEDKSRSSTGNKIDPMQVIAAYRDPFPKADLVGGFLGDRYLRCVDLPSKSFLKKGAVYTLRGGSPLPEYREDPSYYTSNDAERFVLDSSSALYQLLHNGGQYQLTVEIEEDLACTGIECNVDTVRMVKVDDIYYEFKERPCVQMAFYDDGKQIRARENKELGSMCANPNLAHASEACCREERYQEVRSAKKETGVTYFYEGERSTYNTAKDRCVSAGKDLCMFEYTAVNPVNDWWKKGYSWTNRDCEIMVKVNSEGYIAIVHDADLSYKNQIDKYGIPAEVDENETLNWFKVKWNGDFPGSSPENSCEVNKCKTRSDGSCVCRTNVSESAVFDSIENVNKDQIMSELFIGAIGPVAGSLPAVGNGFTAHVVDRQIDASTVFEVQDKGRTFFLKNIVSEVHLHGWEAVPMIIEAEDAVVLQNTTVKNSAELSASNGQYIDFDSTDEAYVTWEVNAPYTGDFLMSLRYAMDTYTRQMEVYVNDVVQKWTSPNANPVIDLVKISNNPQNDPGFEYLDRCNGDCDIDDHCAPGLFCFQVNKGGSVFPGCNNPTGSGSDYCVDPDDIDNMIFLPTGGSDDDWRLSEGKIVSLIKGINTIKLKVPFGNDNAPNVDYLKIEGLPSATITPKFRNPPHFVSLIGEESGHTEQNTIDAQYETDALLEHLVYHDNVAPFLTTRIIQRFGISNPSPRYVKTCAQAFKNGIYSSGGESFGDSNYGSLEALAACVVLDKEATDEAIYEDPAFGALREPILMVMNLLRSFEYSNTLPTEGFDGPPLADFYNTRLWKMDETIGQSPHDFPSVFSFFLPEFIPETGPVMSAQLVAPEATLLDMPKIIGIQNGLISLIKYGLSNCNDGFSSRPGMGNCADNGVYASSIGHLDRVPPGTDVAEMVSEISLLLTAGRLSQDNRDIIEAACSSEPDYDAQYRCIQQLVVFSSEFHSTNTMKKSGEARPEDTAPPTSSTEPYKAIVYLYLSGGADSFHMLAPHTCAPIDVYERFRAIRGKNSLSEGIGLKQEEMLVIEGNSVDQPCTHFGIHPNLPVLQTLYNDGDAAFIANAGLMAEPVDASNYKTFTPVQLFAHNDMKYQTQKEDIFDEFVGTGVQGRIADVLKEKGIPVNLFSISDTQIVNVGEPGGVPPFILSGSGLSDFNKDPSIAGMNAVIQDINNATMKDSGFFAETFSSKLLESMTSHEQLKTLLDSVDVTTSFPDSSVGKQLKMVAQLMKTKESRGVVRDMFYVSQGGYDTHSNMQLNLMENFFDLNGALEAFVAEVKAQGLWDSITLVQFSEFARTLDPNTGDGSDHAWGANHFHFGGAVDGGKVRGLYPDDFVQSPTNPVALSRGRLVPTYPWDAMWKGTAEWFGINDGPEMEKVLPMHANFPGKIYSAADLYV